MMLGIPRSRQGRAGIHHLSRRRRVRRGVVAAAALCVLAAAGGGALAATVEAQRSPAQRSGSAPAPSSPGSAGQETSLATAQNEFAVDLYRRLAGGAAGDNLFFSPYSVFGALAMTAEGARRQTADEMGRALHLPAALRRSGTEAPARPWDLEPVHAAFAASIARLRQGEGVAPAAAARIDSLRGALAKANDEARQARDRGDWQAAQTRQNDARMLAHELNALLPQVDRYQLRVANALWGDARFAFAPEFLRALDRFYGTGGARTVDFRHDAEGARQRINAWVEERTERRVRELLSPGAVSALTRLVLINAIWFKGQWAEVFDAQQTQDAPFWLPDGGAASVPLMHHAIEGARYAAFHADGSFFPTPPTIDYLTHDDPADSTLYPGAGGLQLAELPYKGGELSMLILLPGSPSGLVTLERRLDAARLAAWIGRLEPRTVVTFLPRFRLEQSRELRGPLETMGMSRAFVDPASPRGAQLDGMTTSTDPADALYVSAILHQAFLAVNEEGTEAAAATAVVVTQGVMVSGPQHPFAPTFRADRPFLFLIRDVRSGAILFMGRYAKP